MKEGWLLFLLAAWALGGFLVARSIHLFDRREEGAAFPPHLSFGRLLLLFVIAFLAPSLLVVLFRGFVPEGPLPMLLLLSMALLVVGSWWWIAGNQRRKVFNWGACSRWDKQLLFGALSWLLVFPVAGLVGGVVEFGFTSLLGPDGSEQVAVQMTRDVLGDSLLTAFNAVVLIAIVPLTEELLFRGFLYQWLRRVTNVGWALALSSVIFAAFHLSNAQGVVVNITLFCTLSFLGLALAFLYERQRSLWAPIGLHATFNGMTVFVLMGGMG